MRKFTIVIAETFGGGFDCSARMVSSVPGDIVRAVFDRDPVAFHCDRTDRSYAHDVHELIRDIASVLSHRLYTAQAIQPLWTPDDVLGSGVPDQVGAGNSVQPSLPEQRNG